MSFSNSSGMSDLLVARISSICEAQDGVFRFLASSQRHARRGFDGQESTDRSARCGSHLVIDIPRIDFAAWIKNIDEQRFLGLVLEGGEQIRADLVASVFQTVAGRAILAEYFATLGKVPVERQHGTVIVDHLLTIRGNLAGQ